MNGLNSLRERLRPTRGAAAHVPFALFVTVFLTGMDRELVRNGLLPVPGIAVFVSCMAALAVWLTVGPASSQAGLWQRAAPFLRCYRTFLAAFLALGGLSLTHWLARPDAALRDVLTIPAAFCICAAAAMLPMLPPVRRCPQALLPARLRGLLSERCGRCLAARYVFFSGNEAGRLGHGPQHGSLYGFPAGRAAAGPPPPLHSRPVHAGLGGSDDLSDLVQGGAADLSGAVLRLFSARGRAFSRPPFVHLSRLRGRRRPPGRCRLGLGTVHWRRRERGNRIQDRPFDRTSGLVAPPCRHRRRVPARNIIRTARQTAMEPGRTSRAGPADGRRIRVYRNVKIPPTEERS